MPSEISSEPLLAQNPMPSPSKSKLPIVLLVIILLFFFGSGGLFLGKYLYAPQTKVLVPTLVPKSTAIPAKTSDITANWKTYTNQEYGFSFKYPDTWVIQFLTLEPYSYTVELSPEINKNAPVWPLSINISKKYFFMEAQTEKIESTKENFINVGKKLGLISGYKTSPSGWIGRTIIVKNLNTSLVIRIQKEFETEINQLLSTFEFTKELDSQKRVELNIIRPGLEMFWAEHGKYPTTLKELVPKYIAVMPKDPQTSFEYFYQVSQTGLDYSLSAKLNDGTTYTVNAPK